MAQTDSIAAAWERLNNGIYAIQALGQIFLTTSHYSGYDAEEMSSVFCYMADCLARDRDAFEEAQGEKISDAPRVLEVARG
ncbi:hypothetical protein ACN9M1_07545 [Ralstonia sp. R-29]|uniref:hypothetical protein n=1 Tax=Ralstonia sp. R-29 TaxID=3404059 RepID=UPI003CF147BD